MDRATLAASWGLTEEEFEERSNRIRAINVRNTLTMYHEIMALPQTEHTTELLNDLSDAIDLFHRLGLC